MKNTIGLFIMCIAVFSNTACRHKQTPAISERIAAIQTQPQKNMTKPLIAESIFLDEHIMLNSRNIFSGKSISPTHFVLPKKSSVLLSETDFDTLAFKGTLRINALHFALLESADGIVHRVRVNDVISRAKAKVTAIGVDRVSFEFLADEQLSAANKNITLRVSP